MEKWLQYFETERILKFINEMQLGDLVQDPYFIGGMAALAIITWLLKWQWFSGTIVVVTGFALLLSYTMGQDTSLQEGNNDVLLVFVGGGAVLVAIAIYIFFIRGE